jgi:hypothetical protein
MIMKLRNASLALATMLAALAASSAFDMASAHCATFPNCRRLVDDAVDIELRAFSQGRQAPGAIRYGKTSARNRLVREQDLAAVVSDAPETLRARSEMRGAPSMGRRGMRGMGGSRSNGGMGRR